MEACAQWIIATGLHATIFNLVVCLSIMEFMIEGQANRISLVYNSLLLRIDNINRKFKIMLVFPSNLRLSLVKFAGREKYSKHATELLVSQCISHHTSCVLL